MQSSQKGQKMGEREKYMQEFIHGKSGKRFEKREKVKGGNRQNCSSFLNFEVFCGGGTNLWGVSEYVILGISVCFFVVRPIKRRFSMLLLIIDKLTNKKVHS